MTSKNHTKETTGIVRKGVFDKLIRNFFSLSILQALNIFIPFLVMPFLVQTVGIEKFGLLTFAHTVILVLQVFTEYGFNTIATRDISVNSDNPKSINRIFSEVISTKIVLSVLSFFVLVLLVFCIDKLRENAIIYFLYFGIIIGQSIFPLWLFHGLQEMKYITYINVFFKTTFTVFIFCFVKGQEDIWMVPLFMSLGFISSGIASLIIAYRKFNIKYMLIGVKSIRRQLKSAYYMFMSETQMALIAYINILVVGFMLGDTTAGVYSTAEKVIRAIGNIQTPIINAVFPHISKLMVEDKPNAILFVNRLKKWGSFAFILFSIILFLFSTFLFKLIYKDEPQENVILIFRILLVFPLFAFLDQVLGKLVLLTSGEEKKFFKVFLFSSILCVVLCVSLTYFFGSNGTAIANSIVQFFIMAGMFYYARPILNSKPSV